MMESEVRSFTIDSVSRGYNVCKEIRANPLGEELLCHRDTTIHVILLFARVSSGTYLEAYLQFT